MEEQSRNWERLFADVGRVDQKIDTLGIALSARIDRVDQKIDTLGVALSTRIDGVDQKIDTLGVALSARIDGVDQKIDVLGGALSSRIDGGLTGLRGELATQFHWTIGIMTALFTAVLGAVLTR